MQNKMPYQLPRICCRCGEKQGVTMRQIYDSQRRWSINQKVGAIRLMGVKSYATL